MNISAAISLLFIMITTIFWGVWPITIKKCKGMRSDLYYINFMLGALIITILFSIILTYTPFYNFPTLKEVFSEHYNHLLRAFLGGVLVSIGYILQIASAFLSGIAFAFIVSFSIFMATQALIQILISPHSYYMPILIGLILFLFSAFFFNIACRKNSTKSQICKKSMSFAFISGVLLGVFYPLLDLSLTKGSIERLAPHVATLIFLIGMFLSYIVFACLLHKTPLIDPPLAIGSYFEMAKKKHLLSILGGMLWAIALCLKMITDVIQFELIAYSFYHLAPLIAGAIGIFFYKEYHQNKGSYKFIALSCLFYIVGVILLGIHPWIVL